MHISDNGKLCAVVAAGALLRLVLFCSDSLTLTASRRLELSTPVTSWLSLQEGVHLWKQGLDPYDGQIYRQSPILLFIFAILPSHAVPIVFILADIAAALALVGTLVRRRSKQTATAAPTLWWVAFIALFNPLALGCTIAKSTTTFANCAIACAIYFAADGSPVPCMIAFSTGFHLALPAVLLPPILCLLAQARQKPITWAVVRALPILVVHQLGILAISLSLTGSLSFLRAHTAILTVQDLTPNIGLYWYFFIEMFQHFRSFFLLAFQAHLLCYAIPVTLKLRFDPLQAILVLAGIQATFKSYPSVGDTALYHSILSLMPELVLYMRHPIFTIMAHLYTLLLLPVFHHLWLYAGSANSNFYYASTLVWALANGLGVMDTLSAALKLQFLRESHIAKHEAVKDGIQSLDDDAWSVVQQSINNWQSQSKWGNDCHGSFVATCLIAVYMVGFATIDCYIAPMNFPRCKVFSSGIRLLSQPSFLQVQLGIHCCDQAFQRCRYDGDWDMCAYR